MISIRVEQVLREAVQTAYSNLVTRPTGRAVRTSIQDRLSTGEWAIATLDFTNIQLVDLSCADEVVAKLMADPPAGTYLILHGLHDDQLEAIHHVLEHHQLAAVARDPVRGTLRLVGAATADEVQAFDALAGHPTLTPAALAALTAWEEDRARATLATLARRRLARALEDGYAVPFER